MSSPDLEYLSLEAEPGTDTDSTTDSEISTDDEVTDDHENRIPVGRVIKVIDGYLEANSWIYGQLQQLRLQGWQSAQADRYFSEKERAAEEDPAEASARLERKMMRIAKDMQSRTKAFTIKSQTEPKRILDLSIAPGTFLTYALKRNRSAHALAFNLPEDDGGFAPTVEESEAVRVQMLDVTMLAADMGVDQDEIPESHFEADRFRHSRYFGAGRAYDLVISDGTIEPSWGTYLGSREYRRRLLTQLILGLEHLREGGTMIVMLHKVERIQTIQLLLDFRQFAKLTLFKHGLWSGKLSSFYMVATEVRSTSEKARDAVEKWKREWKVVSLGTDKEWRRERDRLAACGDQGIEGVLKDFGPMLVKLGNIIWQTQIDAIVRAPW